METFPHWLKSATSAALKDPHMTLMTYHIVLRGNAVDVQQKRAIQMLGVLLVGLYVPNPDSHLEIFPLFKIPRIMLALYAIIDILENAYHYIFIENALTRK